MQHVRLGGLLLAVIAHVSAGYAQSYNPAKGETKEITIPSKTYPNGRHGWVYTPAGYPASCRGGCNLILMFDGSMYLGAMPLPEFLDSLIVAKRTDPTVAILFDNGAPPGRLDDLANSKHFADFVANELMPWVRAHYLVTRVASRTIISGSSAGGLGAAYIALAYPTIFGNVLSQSGAFWRGNEGSNDAPYEWLTQQYAKLPKVDVRFFLDVGAMETHGALGGAAPSLLDANRHLRDVLISKGYTLNYFEVPNGQHSPESWRLRLPAGIVTLAPATTSQ
jgi:enterochelin esterase family protein